MHEGGRLHEDTLVATVMSNLGLHHAMASEGIHVVQTAVGDRYVLEEMRRHGYSLGGEQSGHVIMLEHGTTGDGVLTALALGQRVVASQTPLRDLAGVMTRLPQVLVNVKGVDKTRVDTDEQVTEAVRTVETELGADGRVLLRRSGTEPLVRVMVEADSQDRAQEYADQIADVVRERLAL
jgi:phosphoglucosamine mutase